MLIIIMIIIDNHLWTAGWLLIDYQPSIKL